MVGLVGEIELEQRCAPSETGEMSIALEGHAPIGADRLEAPSPQHDTVEHREHRVGREKGHTVDQNLGSRRHSTRRGTGW